MNRTLRLNQTDMLSYLRQHTEDSLYVAMNMGAGKTAVMLHYIAYRKMLGIGHKTLIVSTKRIIRDVWEQESKEWAVTRRLSFSRVTGSKRERVTAFTEHADVYLLTFDCLPWAFELPKFDKKIGKYTFDSVPMPDFDMLVIDESTMLKDYSTRRFKAIKKGLDRFPVRILMSGTVRPQGIDDLYSQIYLIDKGARLGKDITEFRKRYLQRSYNGFKYTELPGAKEQVERLVSDIMFRVDISDYGVKLPGRIDNPVYVDLPIETKKLYDDMEKTAVIQLEQLGNTVTAVNAASILGKCQQIANGFIYEKGETGFNTTHYLHTAKLEALMDIIETLDNGQIMVCYHFQADREILISGLSKRYKVADYTTTPNARELWDTRAVQVLLVHAKSCSHGLNLHTSGAYNIVWYSLIWSLDQFLQAISRLQDRIGQNRCVVNTVLLTRGTVDELIFESLQVRNQSKDEFLKKIQEYTKKRLKS